MAAERLARAGVSTLLIDEKMAWEKPCGGGVTFKAYRQYPFLREGRSHSVSTTWLHSDESPPARLALEKPLLIFSRRELNQLLVSHAEVRRTTFLCAACSSQTSARLKHGRPVRQVV